MRLSRSFLPAGLLLVSLFGCDSNDEIKVYQVDKEAGVPAAAPAADPHAGVPMPAPGAADPHAGLPNAGSPGTAKRPGVVGDVPDAWEPGRGSSMRLASYVVNGEDGAVADISLIILGGGAGGLLDNVNRWRTQVHLAAVDEAGLATSSSKMATPVGEGTVVDLKGDNPAADPTKDGRIVGVIVPLAKELWFYKMRGNPDLLEREKEGFLRWVASAKKTEAPPIAAPTPAAPQPTPPAPTPQAPKEITWNLPEGWREAPSTSSMRLATFSVGANDSPGEVTVIKLSGNGGGDLANVNRWRGQIGLGPITAEVLTASVEKVASPAGAIALIDCPGEEKRTLAGWFARDGSTWFIKLTGPTAVVETERARFTSFLASLDIPAK